jgi:hypothetical protein
MKGVPICHTHIIARSAQGCAAQGCALEVVAIAPGVDEGADLKLPQSGPLALCTERPQAIWG